MLTTLIRGPAGHPLHPPLTDAAIGAYTAATVLCVLSALGVAENRLATGWWLVLLVGLGAGALAALTGLVEWFTIPRGTAIWRTATTHMLVMVSATVLFLLDAIVGYHRGYTSGEIAPLPLVLTIAGFIVLTAGGWLGGSIVFVHGKRVLPATDQPPTKSSTPPGEI